MDFDDNRTYEYRNMQIREAKKTYMNSTGTQGFTLNKSALVVRAALVMSRGEFEELAARYQDASEVYTHAMLQQYR